MPGSNPDALTRADPASSAATASAPPVPPGPGPGTAPASDPGSDPAAPKVRVSRIPIVRRMVGTYSVSAVGSAMVGVAIAYVAFQTSKSLVLTVVVLSAAAIPTLVLLPVAGRLSTGRDPRDIEFAGQVAKIVLSFVIAAVAASGYLTYLFLLTAQLVNGCASALSAPAWPRLVKTISPEGRLAEVTALFGGVASAATIGGALLGGVVCSTYGFTWVFVANGLSYLPFLWAVRTLPRASAATKPAKRAIRAGIRSVRLSASLRRAFFLVVVLNLAAWPVLSVLPAVAGDIDSRAHVLGFLTGAFYAGAAVVAWAVSRLRRHFLYSRILFAGFLTAGLMLLSHAALTSWRSPGYDAVTVAVLTLVPIGLALSVSSTLLQTIVQLGCTARDEGPVLVVYGTMIAILTPIGGLLLGAVADLFSLWWAIALSGVALTTVTIVLRPRLAVFDDLDDSERLAPAGAVHHWQLAHLGSDGAHRALAHLCHPVETVAAAAERSTPVPRVAGPPPSA